MVGIAKPALAALLLLDGCADLPASFKAAPPPPQPLTMPFADGRSERIYIGDGYYYLVAYQGLEQARGKVLLRVTRASAPELTYSDGLPAKTAAEGFCAKYNRLLNPSAYGAFSAPASWVFEGGCQ